MGDEGPVFSKEDIEAAIGNCNFNKAIGIDWFSGKVMKKNNDIRLKLINILLHLAKQLLYSRLCPCGKSCSI